MIESAKALRALGAVVLDALCVIDREAGGPALLADAGPQGGIAFTMSVGSSAELDKPVLSLHRV